MRGIRYFGMRKFKYGDGVIAQNFLLNLLLVKMSEKSSTKADFRGKNQNDMSDDGSNYTLNSLIKVPWVIKVPQPQNSYFKQ